MFFLFLYSRILLARHRLHNFVAFFSTAHAKSNSNQLPILKKGLSLNKKLRTIRKSNTQFNSTSSSQICSSCALCFKIFKYIKMSHIYIFFSVSLIQRDSSSKVRVCDVTARAKVKKTRISI